MTLAACLHRQRFRNFLTVEIGLSRVVSTFRLGALNSHRI
jgi:hypothetical protein